MFQLQNQNEYVGQVKIFTTLLSLSSFS